MTKSRCYFLAILLGLSQVSGAFTRLAPERHHFLSVDGGQGLRNVIFGSVSLRPSLINAGESVTATGDFLGQAIDIQVYDMVGHCIKREQKSGRDIHIDGFHVAGIYTIQITDENGKQYMGRVIVK